MRNDTPDEGTEDSQIPFISERNATSDASVPMDMDTPSTTPMDMDTTAQPEDRAATTAAVAATAGEPTGEMDLIEPTVESTAFDYDSYYGVDPGWTSATPTPPVAPNPEPPTAIEPKRRSDTGLFFVGALAAGVLGAALTVGVLAATGSLSTDDAGTPSTTNAAAQTAELDPSTTQVLPNTIIRNEVGSAVNPTAVAIKAFPSIVTVTTLNEDDQGGLVAQGSGSGVVITADGYIATNDHVVDGASTYQVTFEDGRVYDAELIGTDPLTDLAVIKIEATGLVPIDFGSVDGLELGDPAIAVGNPLGQDGGSSISVGIISAFDRRVDFGDGSSLFGMIQTDAAINSGSSGGSLLNADGDLIGITSAIGVSNAGPEGIGYAIPVNLVQRITDEIIETGDVRHPFLGVTIETYVEELADGATAPRGARIVSIEGTDSAAGSAGLQAGDIIVGIGDKEISSQTDLILAVRLYRVGDSVTFTAIRDGATDDYTVVMGQRPETFGG
jgi:S1-C subfamily serine protease